MDTELDNDYRFVMEQVMGRPLSEFGENVKFAHSIYYGWDNNGYQRSRINMWKNDKIVESWFITHKDDTVNVTVESTNNKIIVLIPKKKDLATQLQDS